jgi:hypothetical protein
MTHGQPYEKFQKFPIYQFQLLVIGIYPSKEINDYIIFTTFFKPLKNGMYHVFLLNQVLKMIIFKIHGIKFDVSKYVIIKLMMD